MTKSNLKNSYNVILVITSPKKRHNFFPICSPPFLITPVSIFYIFYSVSVTNISYFDLCMFGFFFSILDSLEQIFNLKIL